MEQENKKENIELPEEVEGKDLAYLFWEKYEDADMLKRAELIKPLVKHFLDLPAMYEMFKKEGRLDLFEHSVTTQLQSYFDDIFDYHYAKSKEDFIEYENEDSKNIDELDEKSMDGLLGLKGDPDGKM